ncbi:hypothetical protein DFH27DRAFT_579715 [Peziza echinospora]|nr:hypothetical protein DFH27DRAFT_579715 [Peziza echinospora]
MAEALGIASSILAILDASAKIANYLKQVRDAPQERGRFINELRLLDGVLRSLREKKEGQWDLQTLGILQRPVWELEVLLHDLGVRLDESGGGGGGGQLNPSGSTSPPPGPSGFGFPQSPQGGGGGASLNGTTGTTASSSTGGGGGWRSDFREQRAKLAEKARGLKFGKSNTGRNSPSPAAPAPPTSSTSSSSSSSSPNLAQPPPGGAAGSQQTPPGPTTSTFGFGFGKKLAWPFKRGEVVEILATVERYKSYFVLAIQNDIEGLCREIGIQLVDMSSGIRNITDEVSGVHVKIDEIHAAQEAELTRSQKEERRRILAWLSDLNFWTRQIDILTKREAGTGQWFLNNTAFLEWVGGAKPTLLCLGIPGAGKTILASITIDLLERSSQRDEKIAVAFVYCSYKEETQQSASSLTDCIMHQLVLATSDPVPYEAILALYIAHEQRRTRPSQLEQLTTLRAIIPVFSRVYVVIDALDEVSTTEREAFIAVIKRLAELGASVLITSRHIPEIEWSFKATSSTALEIIASTNDVKSFLRGQLQRKAKLERLTINNPGLALEIIDSIAENAKGMFLLAQLHIEAVAECVNSNELREAMRRLPGGLDATYDNALERISSQGPRRLGLAKTILMWITYAVRPLSMKELQHALAVKEGDGSLDEGAVIWEDELLSICGGLVVIDHEAGTVRLIHTTTQEYLVRRGPELFMSPHERITLACFHYLSFNVFGSGFRPYPEVESQLRALPFAAYAAHNWGDHARSALSDLGSDPARVKVFNEMIMMFLMQRDRVVSSLQVERLSWGAKNGLEELNVVAEPLLMGARLGLPLIVEMELGGDMSAPAGGYWQDPRGEIFREWMDGANHVRFLDRALRLAAENGYGPIVEMLLERGADIEARGRIWQTALSLAAANGHADVARLLVGRGANIEAEDGRFGLTPVTWAASRGHEAAVELLIAAGAKIGSNGDLTQNPLHVAVQNDHAGVVVLLLRHISGPGIERPNLLGQRPLAQAAGRGNERVVRLLLGRGAAVDSPDTNFQTALFWAAGKNHAGAVRMLLDSGAAIEARDYVGQTPLSWACEWGREPIVRLLLERGADIEARDTLYGRTPLFWAVENRHMGAARALLASGARVEATDRYGRTPLSIACEKSPARMVGLVLRAGADVRHRDALGKSALSWAVMLPGREAVVSLLLKQGADIEARDGVYGQTLLSLASACGHQASVAILLQAGAQLESRDARYGQTPLSWAAGNGHAHVVWTLLRHGADTESRDLLHSRTPKLFAILGGHTSVVRLLRDASSGSWPSDQTLKDWGLLKETRQHPNWQLQVFVPR